MGITPKTFRPNRIKLKPTSTREEPEMNPLTIEITPVDAESPI